MAQKIWKTFKIKPYSYKLQIIDDCHEYTLCNVCSIWEPFITNDHSWFTIGEDLEANVQ